MLKTNIPGGIAVVAFILLVVGFGISLNTSINWGLYFKILAAVGFIALAVALITRFLPSSEKD
ncbi:hypothetical protein [Candidatus Mycalebacterium sp.]